MLRLKEVHPNTLVDRHARACAKLARIARGDTVFGGARALVIAERMERLKGNQILAHEIVSDVYAASNYSCGEWGAYACPECGQSWLGTTAAYACCALDNSAEDNSIEPVSEFPMQSDDADDVIAGWLQHMLMM